MACSIEKNAKNGKINKILNKDGKTSTLFQEIFNVPTLSLNEAIEAFKNTYSDKIAKTKNNGAERLPQTEEQRSNRGGEIATRTANFLREKGRTDEKNSSDGQKSELEVFSKENNYWLEDYETLGEYIGKGMESQVFLSEDGTSVFKVNDLEFYDTPVGFLNTISEHNNLFPESPYKVVGFTRRNDTDNFSFILEQPFVEAERGATQEEVTNEMGKLGFTKDTSDELFKKSNVEVLDLHEGNVVVDKNGIFYFIDPVIFVKEEIQQITEPKTLFNNFTTYKEAVKNTPIGEQIKITVNNVTIAEVTNEGDVNSLIRQDILEGRRELTPKGDIILITSGKSLGKKLINANIAQEITRGRINGEGNITTRQLLPITEVSEKFEDNVKKLGEDSAVSVLVSKIFEENTPTFGNSRIIDYSVEVPNENELMAKLSNLLQDLGVKTVNLDNYKEQYKKRIGKEVNSNALADISEKIIAFANGQVTQDTLTEEVMHFIVEALPQEQIQPLLDMIHKTDEWKQYSKQYSEIYENDDQVRREILGKVLKNYIQHRQEQTTLQGQSITKKLVDIINTFFEKIRNLFKAQHQKQLDAFKEDIYKKLMVEELYGELKPEQFNGNKLVMYQTKPEILYDSLTKAVKTFKGLDKITGKNFEYRLTDLELDDYSELNQLKAVAGLSNTIKDHITHLTKRGKQSGFLSTEETHVYTVIKTQLEPALVQVKGVLQGTVMNQETLKKKVLNDVQSAMDAITRLEFELNSEKAENFENQIEKVMNELGLTEGMREVLRKEMASQDRDTNQLYALFGGLVQAQNSILNMVSTRVSRMNREYNIQFNTRQNNLLNIANELGFKDEDVNKIMKEFKDGYYFLSPYAFHNLSLEEGGIKVAIYEKISGEKVEVEDFIKNEERLKLKLTQEQLNEYLQDSNEAIRNSGVGIDVLKESERKEIQEATKDFSNRTKNRMNQLSSKKTKIYKRAKENGGLSSEDNFELQQLMHDQQKLSDPYTMEGKLMKGLSVDGDGKVTLREGFTKEDLEEEAKTVYELSSYNTKRQEKFSKTVGGSVPMKFIQEVQRILKPDGETISDLEGAIEFLTLNSRISYNNNFWDTFDKSKSLVQKLRHLGTKEANTLAESIEEKKIRLKNILKQHRKYNNPSQVDLEGSGTMEFNVRDLTESLEYNYQEAKLLLPKESKEVDEDVISESVTNDSYNNQIEDLGIDNSAVYGTKKLLEERIDFILGHVTSSNKRTIARNIENYRKFKEGTLRELPKAFNKFNTGNDVTDILNYAESKLLPYFKELKPESFEIKDFLKDLAQVETEEEYNKVIGNAKYVSISPAYIWLDSESNDRLNPTYVERSEAGEPLINLEYKGGLFKNKKYIETFFNRLEDFKSVSSYPTKDLETDKKGNLVNKKYELLREVIKFQEDTAVSAAMENKHNKYLLPQFRRQSMARLAQIGGDLSVKNVKEALKDAFTIREDNPIMGQSIDGQDSESYQAGALTVPRLGFRKLESEEEVTDEILYSVMKMAKEAELRKQRIGALMDIEAVRTELQNKQYGDKKGEATTAYKMFDNFVRHNIYGQTETFKYETDLFGLLSKKRNLAPLIKQFQGWIRLVNLGFSVLTPITSLFQGSVNYMVEKFVGDRIDKEASKLARSKVIKLVAEASSEMLNVRAKGELNLMMQYFGLESPMERYVNSNYGKALRGLSIDKSAYLTHYLADLPLTAQVITTVLHDFRVVDGELTNYSEWRNRNRKETEQNARSKWANFQNKVAYNYLETKDGEMRMSESFYKEVKNAEDKINHLKNRIQTAKQEVDNQISQEDKGAIQRHAIGSFFSLHRGFLISSMSKRLKDKHLNMYTGQMEEGTYLGTFNFLASMAKDMQKKGLKQTWLEQYKAYDGGYKTFEKGGKYCILKGVGKDEQKFKEYDSKKEMEDAHEDIVAQETRMRQISIKRGLADAVVVNTLAFLGLLMKQLADDDDDDYLKEFAAYSMYRLATEVSGQSVALPAQAYSFLESPTVGLAQLQNAMDIFDLVDDDQVTQGSYRGMSKSKAWMFKSLPFLKEYNKITNIDRTRTSYEHFNSAYLDNFTFSAMMVLDHSKK
jgi:hypothetical protein